MSFENEPGKESIPAEKAARLASLFGITPEELDAAGPDRLVDLVLERVALLEVSK
jgi:tRNA threonylcarbamoyladenosine modification (KEOPS) complex Cgi121 subunit